MRETFFIPGRDETDEYKISEEDCKVQLHRMARKKGWEMGNAEEDFLLDVVCRERNVFLTGSAGTGKSTTIKLLQELLHYFRVQFATTAPTGVAASLLGGRTIHSWLGIGLGPVYERDKDARDYCRTDVQMLFKKTVQDKLNSLQRFSPGKLKTLRSVQVLILDEASMLPGKSLLDFIDAFLKAVRDNDKPFGGVTIVMVGDFMQLPPVSKSRMYEGESDWAFQSEAWRAADIIYHQLTKVHRQQDKLFASCLETIRMGETLNATQMNLLRTCYRDDMTEQDILRTTYIMPKNKMCDDHNMWAVSKLEADLVEIPCEFQIRDKHKFRGDDSGVKRQLLSGTKHKEVLYLKRGCEILMTVNDMEQGFFNGTRARILDMVKGPAGKYSALLVYTNLEYSYEQAKQMMQDLSAEVYMAKLNTCQVSMKATTRGNYEPADDMTTAETPEERAKYGDEEFPKWPRMLQFPVIPAYAVTVHSSQGMSLDRATVNTDESFAYGQVYVALSRVRSAEGLTLVHHDIINPVDPEAKAFHLEVLNQATDRPVCPV